ncbi:MAG: bifunctional 2-polyprenyl-6-hydroxyphenol methylase/3-demethylubiquinol 3-O-methyltransferase UbiG [Sphingobacteriia bacterium]|nr:bifunctional 2-polyprenyl-6-hydroxyphenol methylase/3-demethylubiquinol 3-O-methyltransferase UbiG [Sphingobacteriia bacterium]
MTIDLKEIEKFSKLSEEWWNEEGPFKPLHKINPLRINYIKKHVLDYFNITLDNKPFTGLKFLDVGCGGGLISEPMHRLGAEVTGIDASEKNIKTASFHSKKLDLNINYRCIDTISLANEEQKFDCILALEVIEHVSDIKEFLESLVNLLNDNGIIIITTINRTIKSYLLAILGAEYILRWIPIGTHSWKKFVKPSEIINVTNNYNLKVSNMKGMSFNPIKNEWYLSDDLEVNYLITLKR